MPPITLGAIAPDFSWTATDGKKYALKQALAKGPRLVAFFKVSCPTCQFTFPFLDRFAKHFGNVWGVSQDDSGLTRKFAAKYGAEFPLLLEDTDEYPTSNAYGLTHVPAIFLIGTDGKVVAASTGFQRAELESIAQQLGTLTGKPGFRPFRPGEEIPEHKSG